MVRRGPCGNTAVGINTDASCGRTAYPVIVSHSSLSPDVTVALGSSSGLSDQHRISSNEDPGLEHVFR